MWGCAFLSINMGGSVQLAAVDVSALALARAF